MPYTPIKFLCTPFNTTLPPTWSVSSIIKCQFVRQIYYLGAFTKLRKTIINSVTSVCLSVRMEQLGSNRTDFRKIWVFLENLSRELKFRQNLTRITGTLHEDIHTFTVTSECFLEWEMFQTKVVQKIKTNCMFNNSSPKSCRYEIMPKNMVQ